VPTTFKTTPARSRNMRAIKSTANATTEYRLRAAIVRAGICGWQMHRSDVLGCPDFFFPRTKVAVFVDGCFWHGCPRCGHIPKTNRSYWRKKLARNMQRDLLVRRTLRAEGIRVLRFWECDLRGNRGGCLKKLSRAIRVHEPTS
jgi:DNA mismatch endonuclease, patch repair protein